ncbi:hypothetical protein TNIN_294681 [Trichonephila inaurata madagascariensis]|uniref:Uncharacterized protein n=1 Tax=Trichonephila inaurata madagascariensis TaxID=2747483 RepID=A0A8X6KEK0_9ARAC|nr:hypothetical protein TNIN_294681 [Trichonephila inaurata madagascariensis]
MIPDDLKKENDISKTLDCTPSSEVKFSRSRRIKVPERLNVTIKRSPYKALFGSEPKIGLQSSHILKELLEKLVTEEDLCVYLLLNQQGHDITSTPEDLPIISLKNNNDAS